MIKENIQKYAVPVSAGVAGVAALAPTLAFADDPTVSSTMTTMAGSIATDGVGMITGIIPAVAPLVTAAIVAYLGFKFVKRFTKA